MKVLLAPDLPGYLGKKVNVTVTGKVEPVGPGFVYAYDETTFNEVTLLAYDPDKQLIRFRTKSGEEYELNPKTVEALE